MGDDVLKKSTKDEKQKWMLITDYDVYEYRCGLVAGDRVRLKKDLAIEDWEGRPTGTVYRAGEEWSVLPGAAQDPGVVWFRKANGKRHTWTDGPEVWDWFERVPDENARAEAKNAGQGKRRDKPDGSSE